jgi:hypothetical protein
MTQSQLELIQEALDAIHSPCKGDGAVADMIEEVTDKLEKCIKIENERRKTNAHRSSAPRSRARLWAAYAFSF